MTTNKFTDLMAEIQVCEKCSLSALHYNIYDPKKGYGKLPARFEGCDVMFVGMNPSNKRDPNTKVVYGDHSSSVKAGRRFTELLSEWGILERAYFTNLLKCSTDDNKVSDIYLRRCQDWLYQEIDFIDPKLIVPMGKDAIEFFNARRGFKRYSEEFEVMTYGIYHPNYVFDYNIETLPILKQDLFSILKTINADFPQLLLLFEGPDKAGKTSIEKSLIQMTGYQCITLGRSALSGLVYSMYYDREMPLDLHMNFLSAMEDLEAIVIYCHADTNVLKDRANGTEDENLDFGKIKKIYEAWLDKFAFDVIDIDTTMTSSDEAACQVASKLWKKYGE